MVMSLCLVFSSSGKMVEILMMMMMMMKAVLSQAAH